MIQTDRLHADFTQSADKCSNKMDDFSSRLGCSITRVDIAVLAGAA
jgi:hypothetical protein